jgi:hypothetical protein
MQTKITVFAHFAITVDCACAGPEHEETCDREEKQRGAAGAALQRGVSVDYDDFVEWESN